MRSEKKLNNQEKIKVSAEARKRSIKCESENLKRRCFSHLECSNNTRKSSKYFMFAGIKVGKAKMKRKTYTRWLKYFTACIFPDYVQKNQFMENAINSRKETIKMLDRRQILWSQKFIS